MKTILTNKGQKILVDDDVYEKFGHLTWTLNTEGYPCHNFWSNGKSNVKLLHNLIMGKKEGYMVDHKKTEEKWDNQRSNLRWATHAENQRNCKLYKGCKYRGVSYHKPTGFYYASIHVGNKKINLGCFKSERLAALIRDKASKYLHGAFAVRNFNSPSQLDLCQ